MHRQRDKKSRAHTTEGGRVAPRGDTISRRISAGRREGRTNARPASLRYVSLSRTLCDDINIRPTSIALVKDDVPSSAGSTALRRSILPTTVLRAILKS